MRTSSLLPRSVGVSAMPVRPTFVRKPPSASPVISAAVTGPVYSSNSLPRPHTTAARSASFAPSGPFLRAAVYDDPLFRPENQLDWTAGTKELVDESEWRDSLGEKLSKQEAKKRQKAAVLATVPLPIAVRHDLEAVARHSFHILYTNRYLLRGSDGGYAKPMLNADKLFKFCVKAEVAFLVTNLCLTTPLLFEALMSAHLQYASLALAWWSAVYVGLDLAKYPGWVLPGPIILLRYRRTATACIVFSLGVLGLLFTETSMQAAFGPWISYALLLSGYVVMLVADRHFMKLMALPTWLTRWKLLLNVIAIASLAASCAKGKALGREAADLLNQQRQAGKYESSSSLM
mmetsp:Transcript_19243/g.48141  ORF Transcript_19243/g.48141 Transcript_19243/m.48141 type:complete len:347 (-) Transcript_19243:164-1204(-)